ncbi:hypothetical protein ACFX16_003912 [Malus domestica]
MVKDEQAAASPSFLLPAVSFRVGLDARINHASPGRQAPAPRLFPCSMRSPHSSTTVSKRVAIVTTASHKQDSSSPFSSPTPSTQRGCFAPAQPTAYLPPAPVHPAISRGEKNFSDCCQTTSRS